MQLYWSVDDIIIVTLNPIAIKQVQHLYKPLKILGNLKHFLNIEALSLAWWSICSHFICALPSLHLLS